MLDFENVGASVEVVFVFPLAIAGVVAVVTALDAIVRPKPKKWYVSGQLSYISKAK